MLIFIKLAVTGKLLVFGKFKKIEGWRKDIQNLLWPFYYNFFGLATGVQSTGWLLLGAIR